MSYTLRSTLLTDVNNYLESGITDAVFSPLLRMAEDRIHSLVSIHDQKKETTITLSAAADLNNLPDDFYGFVSVSINENNLTTDFIFLEQKSIDYMETAFPAANESGVPRYYAIDINSSSSTGEQILTKPKADKEYRLNIRYIGKPISLADGTATYLGMEFPELLFFGTLVECAAYLKEPPDVQASLENRFQQAVARTKNMTEGQAQRDQYRYGSIRQIPS